MARAAANPALMFGAETMGYSDTALFHSRVQIAAAASPQSSGKNPDCILVVLDGPRGALDPAFNAHCEVVKFWASAWWEKWVNYDLLNCALTLAYNKLTERRASPWSVVSGPATAPFRFSLAHWLGTQDSS